MASAPSNELDLFCGDFSLFGGAGEEDEDNYDYANTNEKDLHTTTSHRGVALLPSQHKDAHGNVLAYYGHKKRKKGSKKRVRISIPHAGDAVFADNFSATEISAALSINGTGNNDGTTSSQEHQLQNNVVTEILPATCSFEAAGYHYPPESEEGNCEYKRMLYQCTPQRLQQLTTQMQYRLREGNGRCVYRIGVDDDGFVRGILTIELEESLKNLYCCAHTIDGRMRIQVMRIPIGKTEAEESSRPEPRWAAEVQLEYSDPLDGADFPEEGKLILGTIPEINSANAGNQQQNQSNSKLQSTLPSGNSNSKHQTSEDYYHRKSSSTTLQAKRDLQQKLVKSRVVFCGPNNVGKSSLIGCLTKDIPTTNSCDNGSGLARSLVLQFPHEVLSGGVTSSISKHLFSSMNQQNNMSTSAEQLRQNSSTQQTTCELLDVPGDVRYMKTTLRGILGCNNFTPLLLVHDGRQPFSNEFKKYVELAKALDRRLMVVLTKCDFYYGGGTGGASTTSGEQYNSTSSMSYASSGTMLTSPVNSSRKNGTTTTFSGHINNSFTTANDSDAVTGIGTTALQMNISSSLLSPSAAPAPDVAAAAANKFGFNPRCRGGVATTGVIGAATTSSSYGNHFQPRPTPTGELHLHQQPSTSVHHHHHHHPSSMTSNTSTSAVVENLNSFDDLGSLFGGQFGEHDHVDTWLESDPLETYTTSPGKISAAAISTSFFSTPVHNKSRTGSKNSSNGENNNNKRKMTAVEQKRLKQEKMRQQQKQKEEELTELIKQMNIDVQEIDEKSPEWKELSRRGRKRARRERLEKVAELRKELAVRNRHGSSRTINPDGTSCRSKRRSLSDEEEEFLDQLEVLEERKLKRDELQRANADVEAHNLEQDFSETTFLDETQSEIEDGAGGRREKEGTAAAADATPSSPLCNTNQHVDQGRSVAPDQQEEPSGSELTTQQSSTDNATSSREVSKIASSTSTRGNKINLLKQNLSSSSNAPAPAPPVGAAVPLRPDSPLVGSNTPPNWRGERFRIESQSSFLDEDLFSVNSSPEKAAIVVPRKTRRQRPRHAKALTFSAGVTPPKFLQPSFSSSGAASDVMPAAGGAPTSSCGPSSCSYFQGGAVASIPHLDQQQQPHQIRKTISLTDEVLQPVDSDTRILAPRNNNRRWSEDSISSQASEVLAERYSWLEQKRQRKEEWTKKMKIEVEEETSKTSKQIEILLQDHAKIAERIKTDEGCNKSTSGLKMLHRSDIMTTAEEDDQQAGNTTSQIEKTISTESAAQGNTTAGGTGAVPTSCSTGSSNIIISANSKIIYHNSIKSLKAIESSHSFQENFTKTEYFQQNFTLVQKEKDINLFLRKMKTINKPGITYNDEFQNPQTKYHSNRKIPVLAVSCVTRYNFGLLEFLLTHPNFFSIQPSFLGFYGVKLVIDFVCKTTDEHSGYLVVGGNTVGTLKKGDVFKLGPIERPGMNSSGPTSSTFGAAANRRKRVRASSNTSAYSTENNADNSDISGPRKVVSKTTASNTTSSSKTTTTAGGRGSLSQKQRGEIKGKNRRNPEDEELRVQVVSIRTLQRQPVNVLTTGQSCTVQLKLCPPPPKTTTATHQGSGNCAGEDSNNSAGGGNTTSSTTAATGTASDETSVAGTAVAAGSCTATSTTSSRQLLTSSNRTRSSRQLKRQNSSLTNYHRLIRSGVWLYSCNQDNLDRTQTQLSCYFRRYCHVKLRLLDDPHQLACSPRQQQQQQQIIAGTASGPASAGNTVLQKDDHFLLYLHSSRQNVRIAWATKICENEYCCGVVFLRRKDICIPGLQVVAVRDGVKWIAAGEIISLKQMKHMTNAAK